MSSEGITSAPSAAGFAPTQWTIVLSARAMDSPEASAALEALCRAYWHPLYAFARRQGSSQHDAQDLTQAFFSRMLEKEFLRSVAPEKGRFRSFLIVAFKRFLANERERENAQKRGGGNVAIPLDIEAAEGLYQRELRDDASAEYIYERRWALTLVERTMSGLREEFTAAGKTTEFEQLKIFLTAPKGEASYADVAAALQMNPGAARVAAHRLRRRFRERFRAEIGQTVTSTEEIDDELRHLFAVLAR